MTRVALQKGLYGSNDIVVGDWIDCGSVTVTADLILRFAELTGDRFEIHMSDDAARRHGFARQVAHGLLVLSLVDGLKNTAPAQFNARASKGWEWTFKAPVMAEDRLTAKLTVSAKRRARQPDQETLVLDFSVHNQDGLLVQNGSNQLLVYR